MNDSGEEGSCCTRTSKLPSLPKVDREVEVERPAIRASMPSVDVRNPLPMISKSLRATRTSPPSILTREPYLASFPGSMTLQPKSPLYVYIAFIIMDSRSRTLFAILQMTALPPMTTAESLVK